MSYIETACNYAVGIANDNSHGYSQINRWLPDVDCSSFMILSWEQVLPVRDAGATYTGNMRQAFVKCGFEEIPYKKGMALIRGDVILCDKYVRVNGTKKYYGHTCMYLGNGKIVQASISETGGITGKQGDQTGREVAVGNFYEYSKGWDYVLRYPDKKGETVMIEMQVLSYGSRGEQVKTLQRLLNALGYGSLKIDGDYGNATKASVGRMQEAMKQKNLIQNVDYIVGEKSWNYILKG